MRVLLQRVQSASVVIENETVGSISAGLLLLVGFGKEDSERDLKLQLFRDKILGLRIFPDETGKFDRSVRDVAGGVLLVSQFTLYGNCSKGRRPDFTDALNPPVAKELYERFVSLFAEAHSTVQSGIFGANMQVHLVNDGPVTMQLEW